MTETTHTDTTRTDTTRTDPNADTTHAAGTRADEGTIDLREGQDLQEDPRQHPGQDPLDTATPVDQLDRDDRDGRDDHDGRDGRDGPALSTSDLVDRGNQGGGTDRAGRPDEDEQATPLISDGDAYLERWQQVQAGFVDDPRTAVQHADTLVAEVIQRIAQSFADERDQLEKQWSGGENVGTEELRVQLQRYRSFFTRLLHT
jgi:hypothetical protein